MTNNQSFTYAGGGFDGLPDDIPDWALKLIEDGDLYEVYDCGMACMAYRNAQGQTEFMERDKQYTPDNFIKRD